MVTMTYICQECGREFDYTRTDARGAVKRWCSDRCRYRERDQANRRPCANGCGSLVWRGGKGSLPDAMCRPCRAATRRGGNAKTCASCGVDYIPVKWRPGPQYCPDPVCRQAYRGTPTASPWSPNLSPAENALRANPRKTEESERRSQFRAARKRLRSALVPGIGDEAIYQRDRWTCHLCDLPVSRTLAHPHPMSPSIDHLVPIDSDGSDDPANLATAHLACNLHKHTAAMGEQLRLIG